MASENNAFLPRPPGNNIPRHWFYAAISPSAEIFKCDADTCSGFTERIGTSALVWIDYWTDDFSKEAATAAESLGFSNNLITALLGEIPTTYEDLDSELGFRLPAIHVEGLEVQIHPLLMLIKNNFILTIHPLTVDRRFARMRRYADTILKKIPAGSPAEDKLTVILMRIIDENNSRNFSYLRQIDERGDDLNQNLINPAIPRDQLGPEIYQLKHALINYMDSLWETVDVLNDLRYGDAELITNDAGLLDRMTHLIMDVNRQIELSEHMSDVLASGLEVMQSIYNNQLQALNNRLAMVMTYLTIIGTAVLVPNTLATVMSNSAFSMGPQDRWWYIIVLVVATVVSTWLAYWWVKKRGWLPKQVD